MRRSCAGPWPALPSRPRPSTSGAGSAAPAPAPANGRRTCAASSASEGSGFGRGGLCGASRRRARVRLQGGRKNRARFSGQPFQVPQARPRISKGLQTRKGLGSFAPRPFAQALGAPVCPLPLWARGQPSAAPPRLCLKSPRQQRQDEDQDTKCIGNSFISKSIHQRHPKISQQDSGRLGL